MSPPQPGNSDTAGRLVAFVVGVAVGIVAGWALMQGGWRLEPMGYDELIPLAKVLAWPVMILVVITMFRRQIAKKIEEMLRARFPGGEVEWGTALADTAALVEFGGPGGGSSGS